MAELAELKEALRKADAQGNVEDARRLAAAIRAQQASPPTESAASALLPRAGAGERFAAGAQESVAGLMQTLAHLAPGMPDLTRLADASATRTTQNANALSESLGGDTDVARLVGNVAATLPASLITARGVPAVAPGLAIRGGQNFLRQQVPRLAAAGAAEGAFQGLVAPVDVTANPDFWEAKGNQIGAGTATGALLSPVAAYGLKTLGGAIGKSVKVLQQQLGGTLTPQQIEIRIRNELQTHGIDWDALSQAERDAVLADRELAKLRPGDELDPTVLANRTTLARAGVRNPTRAQLTQDPEQFGRENYLASGPYGGDLARQKQTSFDALNQRLQQIQDNAPVALDREDAGQVIMRPLSEADRAEVQRIEQLYEGARRTPAARQPVDPERVLYYVNEELSRTPGAIHLGKGIPAKLQILARGGNPNTLQITPDGNEEMAQAISGRTFNLADAEALSQFINAQYGIEPGLDRAAVSAAQRGVQRAADEAVGGNNPFTAGRAAYALRMQRMEAIPALQAVADGKVTPDQFLVRYVTGDAAPNEGLRNLKAYLSRSAPDVWGQVRGQVLEDLYQAASSGKGNTFNVERYNRELNRLQARGKAKILFDKAEWEDLRNLGAAGRLVSGPPSQPKPTGLSGAAYAAAGLSRVIRSLGTLTRAAPVLGPVVEAVESAPTKAAVREAQAGAPLVRRTTPSPAELQPWQTRFTLSGITPAASRDAVND